MTRRALAAALLTLLAAARIDAQDGLGVPVPIDDPGGRVVARARSALERAGRGEGIARLAFWGASHTASDQYTGFLRERLQRRFGDAGAGLVMPAMPFPLYARRDVTLEHSAQWSGVRVRGRERVPDHYGRAGFAIETRAASWARVRTTSPATHVELWAMAQPGGGTLELRAGEARAELRTDGALGTTLAALDVSNARALEVRARGDGAARVFGVLHERGTAGVVVESFGVPGARAADQLPWDEATLRDQIARRPPDLVGLAYGTNESGDRTPLAILDRDLRQVIARWRRIAPDAACLVIGPSDWPLVQGAALAARPRSTEVRDLYRRVALAEGCGFFDLLALQGGPGSLQRWIDAGWALTDHVHMTDAGHARVAALLERALLAQ